MKLKALQEYMGKNKIGLSLFMNSSLNRKDSNLTYLSQIDAEHATLAVTRNSSVLFVPEIDYEKARKCSIIKNVAIPKKKIFQSIRSKFRNKVSKIGVNENSISLYEYKRLKQTFKSKCVDVSGFCSDLRKIKTYQEIENIRKACHIADVIMQKCLNHFEFKTESEVAAFLESEAKIVGCEPAFKTIVASGRNASQPHYLSNNAKLNKGFCVIDFGVKYGNYCSDISRTVYIGKPSAKEKKIYNLVLDAQKKSISEIREGMLCSDLDSFARKRLGKYGKCFIHSLGHGIGIDIHELPNVSYKSKERIERGMVFTVEPGIYIKNKMGIRIEDSVLLDKKLSVLTKTSKELVII